MRFQVRRLAALDLVGARGSALRRRLVLAEFLAAAAAGLLVGGWLLPGGGVTGAVVGLGCLGIGANYLALAVHAVDLVRADRLGAELSLLPDPASEARWYTVAQLLLLVPFLLAALAAVQRRRAVRPAVGPADVMEGPGPQAPGTTSPHS